MKQRRKRSIFRAEHGAEIDAAPPPPEDLLRLLEPDAGRGISNDPDDMVWTGGADPIRDLDVRLSGDLDEVGALDEILLAVIGSNCDFPFPPEEGSADGKAVRRRL